MINSLLIKGPSGLKPDYHITAGHFLRVLVNAIRDKRPNPWLNNSSYYRSIRVDGCEDFFGSRVSQEMFVEWIKREESKRANVLLTFNRLPHGNSQIYNNDPDFLKLLGLDPAKYFDKYDDQFKFPSQVSGIV